MSRFTAIPPLVRMLGAPIYRRRQSIYFGFLFSLVSGFGVGRWPQGFSPPAFLSDPIPKSGCAADLPTVALDGWFTSPPFTWPGAVTDAASAAVLVSMKAPARCEKGLTADCVSRTRLIITAADPSSDGHDATLVRQCLDDRLAAAQAARLAAIGLPVDPAAPVTLTVTDPPDPGGLNRVAALLFASLAMSAASVGGSTLPSARMSGVLEAVFATGVPRRTIGEAFFALVLGSGLTAGLVSLVALVIGGLSGPGVPLDAHLWMLPAVLILAVGATLATVVGARSLTEGHVRLVLPMFGPLLLAGLARLLDSHGGHVGALVPFGGAVSLLLDTRPLGLAPALGAYAVSGLTAAACYAYVIRQFTSGSVVEPESGGTLARHAAGNYLPEAILLGLVPIPGMVLIFGVLKNLDPWAMTAMDVGAFAVPAVVVPLALGLPVRTALSLRLPPTRAWVLIPGLVAATLAAGGAAMWFVSLFWTAHATELADYGDAVAKIPLVILTLGAGIPEDLLFRGAVLGLLLRRLKPSQAIVLQALLFALAHGELYKLAPTFAIGCVLGWVCWRTRSVLPGMLIHALHNGVLGVGLFDEFTASDLAGLTLAGALAALLLARAPAPEAPVTTR